MYVYCIPLLGGGGGNVQADSGGGVFIFFREEPRGATDGG